MDCEVFRVDRVKKYKKYGIRVRYYYEYVVEYGRMTPDF